MADEFGPRTRLLDRGVRVLALLGGMVLLWIMGLVVYSVCMRYFFNAPPLGVYDAAQVSLVPVVFFALAYTGWTGGHIAVDLIGSLGIPGLTRITDTFVRLVSTVLLGVLTWRAVINAGEALEFEEVTNLVEIPHFPFVCIMIFGAGVFTIVSLVQAYRCFRGLNDNAAP